MELNPSQLKAVKHFEGPMLVSAGPGSGKTAVIVQRVKNLTDVYSVDPGSILTVTFTRAAAGEMAERFRKISRCTSAFPVFGTFHSVFLNMLREGGSLKSSRIISDKQKYGFFKSLADRYRIDCDDADQLITSIISDVGRFRNFTGPSAVFTPALTDNDTFLRIFADYRKMLSSEHMLDLDDILEKTYSLLSSDPGLLDIWRRKYKYVLIDEFQDINTIQYDIVRLLAAPANNIFAVGDDDQNIYGFRGALKNACRIFLSDFPGCRHVTLDVNYRCCQEIIDVSGKLISANPDRLAKKITGIRKGCEKSVSVVSYSDQRVEYNTLVNEVLRLHESGVPFSEIAVLNRGSRYIPDISRALTDKDIPVFTRSSVSTVYDHFVFKDILAYFRLAEDAADRQDLLRVLNRPYRNISRSAVAMCDSCKPISGILNYYSSDACMREKVTMLIRQLEFLKRLPPAAGVEFIMNAVGYRDYLKQYAYFRQEDPDVYFRKAAEVKSCAAGFNSIENFLEYVSSEKEKTASGGQDREAGVNVITVHASKGLEFDSVFIPDLNKGIFPPGRISDPDHICEERRLLYVAMTRAINRLYISYSDRILSKKVPPSMFVSELLSRNP